MQPFSVSELHFPPLPEDAVGICLPPGIGDVSWIVSKIWSLPHTQGHPIYLSTPGGKPQRSHQLVELLPSKYGIGWAGYTDGRTADVLGQAEDTDLRELTPGKWHCVAVNRWLEEGKPLVAWEPWLPIDYHYELSFTPEELQQAEEIREKTAGYYSKLAAVYVSNRDKANYPTWALWSTEEWCEVFKTIWEKHGYGFVLLGAEYDRDRLNDVAAFLGEERIPYGRCVGRPLGVAVELLRLADLFLAYPSGIGILADVVNTPGVMLLPHPLRKMERTYADPAHLDAGTYRAWTTPSPEGVIKWVENLLK